MAKIKEIIVECKLSKNYNTHGFSEVIIIEDGDDVELIKKQAHQRCRMACMNEFKVDAQFK